MVSRLNNNVKARNKKFHTGKYAANDIDEFWNDCLHVEQSAQSSRINSIENSEQYITFSDNTTKKYFKSASASGLNKNNSTNNNNNINAAKSIKYNNLAAKYNFDHIYTKDEILEQQNEDQKKKQSIERCYLLYEKGKIKNEINRIMYHKNEELKIQKELKNCTWKPELNKRCGKLEENLKIIMKDTKIYNRGVRWKVQTNQKINRSKSELLREAVEHTFKPIV
jgi:hypothetical protein